MPFLLSFVVHTKATPFYTFDFILATAKGINVSE